MNLRPLSNKVLILPDTLDERSPGGIIIPKTAEGKATTGRIIATGPKAEEFVTTGQTVMFPAYSGIEVEVDNVKHRLLPVEEILGVTG